MRAALTILVVWAVQTHAQGLEPEVAARAFAEAKAASDRDGKRLWGVAVYGPTLLFLPEGGVAANQADAEGRLVADAGVWVGSLGDTVAANTSLEWAGVRWAAINYGSLHDLRQDRVRLMMHESFHRLQPTLGVPATDAINSHLDEADGRIWLQYEWRALERALLSQGPERVRAVGDALAFRAFRRARYAAVHADAQENALETNEGLAEYTGVTLAADSPADQVALAVQRLKRGHDKPTFVRSFAYVSGPAYGTLLDATGKPWRKGLRGVVDLGALLGKALGVPPPRGTEPDAVTRAAGYGDDITWFERRSEQARATLRAEVRARYVEGPVLRLSAGPAFTMTFDPNSVVSLDETATFYRGATFGDDWGTVSGDALVLRAGGATTVVLPAVVNGQLKTAAAELSLKPGWGIVPDGRPGDQRLAPKAAAPTKR